MTDPHLWTGADIAAETRRRIDTDQRKETTMTTHAIPDALPRIRAAIDAGILTGGGWGDGATAVGVMGAAVPGAQHTEDCVTAGWPEWLAELNVDLFDATVGAEDEGKARQHFALSVAEAVSKPVDFDKARDLFLIRRLDTGDHSALKSLDALDGDWQEKKEVVESVVKLLHRRVAGEDVAEEMEAARAAAYAVAPVAEAAASAAEAAADAARADLIFALHEAAE